MGKARRVYVKKREGFGQIDDMLTHMFQKDYGIKSLKKISSIQIYDVQGLEEDSFSKACQCVFSEPNTDEIVFDTDALEKADYEFRIRPVQGQFDQKADSAEQCVYVMTMGVRPSVVTSILYQIKGNLSKKDINKIKTELINPVETIEVPLYETEILRKKDSKSEKTFYLEGFNTKSEKELEDLQKYLGLTLSIQDLIHCQGYFENTAKRNPTETELKILDTYWSDHCRHTTFLTEIQNLVIEDGPFCEPIKKAWIQCQEEKKYLEKKDMPLCLMDLATMEMKSQLSKGLLQDKERTDEINACSIETTVDIDGKPVPYLILFKNETHNHPTEIEPYGGAATCLGGAIRDPLSGRGYVYQSMRITGSANPNTSIEDTWKGKLPQRKITREAARGFSSYGNQIGLATGHVKEIYHPGYMAKRMEIGAVVGAVAKGQVVRKTPQEGDVVLLIGGKTGRDGIGGATGSSRIHTEESLKTAGAEVQKGNPVEERKLQRLFRNPKVSKMIKKSNDFGAGGVAVAVGELAESLDVYLDNVPLKYEGLSGMEIALSESQERMAVVVDSKNEQTLVQAARAENLLAVRVATVTETGQLRFFWKDEAIFDVHRWFLETNGIREKANAFIKAPTKLFKTFDNVENSMGSKKFFQQLEENLSSLNVACQKGLVETFDATVGSRTVLMPLGGQEQMTPVQGMVAKVPIFKGKTNTGTVMTCGCDPSLTEASPFHGGYYAVIEAMAKSVALGAGHSNLRLSMQEYFPRLGKNPEKWGLPISALLGAYWAQNKLELPAIGGKDSMSGTFKEKNVPPTIAAFALKTMDVRQVISPEYKQVDSDLVVYFPRQNTNGLLDEEKLKEDYAQISQFMKEKIVLSAMAVEMGGVASAVCKMAFGNRIGAILFDDFSQQNWFSPWYGGLVLEVKKNKNPWQKSKHTESFFTIGRTTKEEQVFFGNDGKTLEELKSIWTKPLENIFPIHLPPKKDEPVKTSTFQSDVKKRPSFFLGQPRAFVPVFPGTNCEDDTERALVKAGAKVMTHVFCNQSLSDMEASVKAFLKAIKKSQIIVFPGGFSAGDEPDGSGKFIASVFRHPQLADALMEHIYMKDGLILGICNGFQALVKLGLLPDGKIKPLSEHSPTLTHNTIGRHISRIAPVRIASTLSPWLRGNETGQIYKNVFSHGEGRFICDKETFARLEKQGQIATQYVDDRTGKATMDEKFNINGSSFAIEGVSSPDGRILGKMGHVERVEKNLYANVKGVVDMGIFKNGVAYYR